MSVAFYISGHGFGHSIRQIEIINALLRREPDLPVTVRTNAAEWLFARTVRGEIAFRPGDVDPGVVQIDGLRLDERATIERARAFYGTLPSRAEEEAGRLQSGHAALVVADAPPLACAAARLAGIPCVVCANFTWDWIYAGYRDVAPDVDPLVARLQEAYALAGAAWRLPMHGGFASVGTVVDVPFVARHARSDRTRDRIREDLHLPDTQALALVSFGGYGIRELPIDQLDCLGDWQLVLTTPRAQLAGAPVRRGVHVVPEELLYERELRYEDLVKAVDVVVTKPGYGIISDCLANGTPLLYTSRGRFAEYDVLVREMPDVLRCRYLEMDAFLSGRWRAGLDAVMATPAPRVHPRTDGAEEIARMIANTLRPPAAERAGGRATT